MIIKHADDKQPDLSILKKLLTHPDADAATRKRIEQEISNIEKGILGENESAYEMKVHFGESKNWMIIHDLRIEHGGVAAQIDHLIINRWLEMWVCESKHFSKGVESNEYGEFSAFGFDGDSYGIGSPIKQNGNHISILQRWFDSKAVKLPKRLWFITIKPNLKNLVLVSKNAKINRPKEKFDDIDCIIKNEHLFKSIDKSSDNSNPLMLVKMVSQKTLKPFAEDIVKLHRPIKPNWNAKFGLSLFTQKHPSSQTKQPISAGEELKKPTQERNYCSCGEPVTNYDVTVCKSRQKTFGGNVYCVKCQQQLISQATQPIQATENPQKSSPEYNCYHCGKAVTKGVVDFCKDKKAKFGGDTYCMECQQELATPTTQPIHTTEEPQKSIEKHNCFHCDAAVDDDVVSFCKSREWKFGGNIYCRNCQNTKFNCFSCGTKLSNRVVNFCKDQGVKFGGNTYCMECQKQFVG